MTGLAMLDEPKPLRTGMQTVRPDWIDYNGHMNVTYYTLAFDTALDEVYDLLGIGGSLAREARIGPMALQAHYHYFAELLEGSRLACDALLLDADAKRVHVFLTMMDLDKDRPAATCECLTMAVDLVGRRSVPIPALSQARIDRMMRAQGGLARPPQVGAPLGIRRR